MNRKFQGHLAIIAVEITFGLSIPVTKALIPEWITPSGYTLMRMLFGAIVFWAVGYFMPKEKVIPKDLLILVVGGFFGFIATQLLFALAL